MNSVLIDPTLRRARIVRVFLFLVAVLLVGTATLFVQGLRPEPRAPLALPAPRRAAELAGHWAAHGQRTAAGQRHRLTHAHELVKVDPTLAPVARRELIAFVEPTARGTLESLGAHASQITEVATTGLVLEAGARLADKIDPRVLDLARALKIPATALLQNLDARGFRPDFVRPLRSRRRREAFADALVAAARRHGLRGIHLDLEELEDQDWITAALLAERLRAAGLTVAACVPAFLEEEPLARIARAADRVVLMIYDETDPDHGPGPIASDAFVAATLAAAKVVPAEKLVAGLPVYAYDWTDSHPADAISFVDAHVAAREARVLPAWDPSGNLRFRFVDDEGTHDVWMTDAATLANHLDTAARAGARAVALWRLGGEDPGIWPVLAGEPVPAPVPADLSVRNFGDGPFLTLAQSAEAGRRVIVREGARLVERWIASPSPYVVRRAGIVPGRVALTFDDGPDPRYTPAILATLAREHAPAAFFVIGAAAARAPELVRRAFAEGHEIGNHSFTHPNVDTVSDRRLAFELEATSQLVESLLGRRPLLYRPPSLADIEPRTLDGARAFARAGALGYLVVDADIDPRDWEKHTAAELIEQVLDDAEDGGVVLLHDGGGDRSTTVAALPAIVRGLRERGLEIVPLTKLVRKTRDEVMPAAPRRSLASATAERAVFRAGSTVWTWAARALALALVLVAARALLLTVLAVVAERRRRVFRGPLPSCTVVIPAYNERAGIVRTVSSVLSSDVPLKVIVVDDGSHDGTGDLVRRAWPADPRVCVLAQPNRGKAAALRAGMAAAGGEVVVALDGDTLFARDTVRRLLEPFLDPRVGAVAGTAEVGNVENVLTACQALEYLVQQELERRAFSALGAVPIVPGAVGAWRRAAVARAGGFSSETLAEDADLAMAIARAGWRVVHAPGARAHTEAPARVRDLVKQRFRWSFGVLQAMWKHRGALVERRAGAFGRVVLPVMIVYQVLLPLLAPLAFAGAGAAIAGGRLGIAAGTSAVLFGAELCQALVACALERRGRWRLLPWLVVSRLWVRPILFVVAARSLVRVLDGIPLGWGKLDRRGTVAPPEERMLHVDS